MAGEDRWAHRSDSMRCRTCMFFVPKAGELGRCRRRAPTLSGWPAVFQTDWCGDHKLDESKLPIRFTSGEFGSSSIAAANEPQQAGFTRAVSDQLHELSRDAAKDRQRITDEMPLSPDDERSLKRAARNLVNRKLRRARAAEEGAQEEGLKTNDLTAEQHQDLHDRFHYHAPSQDGVERHAELSDSFNNLAIVVMQIVPPGRERSLVLTKLEEAKFWASAGVARNKETC